MLERMTNPKTNQLTSARGVAALAVDATVAVANMAQDLHQRIARPFPISGLTLANGVYASVRGIAKGAGAALDALLRTFESGSAEPQRAPLPAALVSILNGVCGDHLHAAGNPLALRMQLLDQGGNPITDAVLMSQKFALFVHGLCLSPNDWGSALIACVVQRGYTPVFVHYNSGRRVVDSGAALADLLHALMPKSSAGAACHGVVIAHSMGGLVLRAALASADAAKMPWRGHLDAAFFLGTPHLGAPLERAGAWVAGLWQAAPFAAALAPIAALRSAGIVDLRYGQIGAADPRSAPPVLMPRGLMCFALAGTLSLSSEQPNAAAALPRTLLGDGLVPVASALAFAAGVRAVFPAQRSAVLARTGHLDLLHAPQVVAKIDEWLNEPALDRRA